MVKFIFLFFFSLTFIISGLLLTRSSQTNKIATKQITTQDFDYDNTCNNNYYLKTSLSLELEKSPVKSYFVIKQGDSLNSILKPAGISLVEIAALSKALYPFVRPNEISAGDLYDFKITNNDLGPTLAYFTLEKIDPNSIPILYNLTPNSNSTKPSFEIIISQPEILITEELVVLEVQKTLFQTFMNIQYGNELMQRLISTLLWVIKIPEEVSNGDKIEILVEHKYAANNFVGFGKIKNIIYKQNNRVISAHYFSSKDKLINGYFDNTGVSIEKEFLTSPVEENTATSNQKWRVHPVRKRRIKHNGTDYRGSIGTPFYSIADGQVTEKRFDINVGHMIRIKHKHGVYTEYFHANSLEKNLTVGSNIKKNQKIGEIGRTGKLCTGPHLHMGVYTYKSGKKSFISLASLKNKLAKAKDIPTKYLPEFFENKNSLANLISEKKDKLAQAK